MFFEFENPSEHRQSRILINFFFFTLAKFYEPPNQIANIAGSVRERFLINES